MMESRKNIKSPRRENDGRRNARIIVQHLSRSGYIYGHTFETVLEYNKHA